MKTLFKDPLFYKEWKTSKWISLLMTIVLFWNKTKNIFSQLQWQKYMMGTDKKFVFDKIWFNQYLIGWNGSTLIFALVLIMLLSVLLFKGEKQDSTCDLLHSMPFKRKHIILSKIKVGILTIIIPFIVNFIMVTVFYFSNKFYIGSSYLDIPKYFSINLLFSLFFFIFLVFIQVIVGQYFAAAIFAPIILFVPNMISSYVVDLIRFREHLVYESYRNMALNNFVRNTNIYEIIDTKSIDRTKILPNGEKHTEVIKFVYENFDIKIMVLICLIVIFSILSVIIYNKVKLERINELIIFKQVEVIFKLGVGICVGMIASMIFGHPKGPEQIVNMPLIYITLLLGTVIGYFISKLVIKFFSK